MATAKKGIVDQAMQSKPVKAARGLVNSAIEAFNEPPLAPDTAVTKSAPRVGAKKSTAKRAGKNMDRKLVSAMEDYEVKYLAQKHNVTQKAVRAAVGKVGNSRNKVEAELRK